MIPYDIPTKDKDHHNYGILLKKLKVSMELVETAIFNLDSFMNVSVLPNGFTLRDNCANQLTEQFEYLVTSLDVKGGVSLRKNGLDKRCLALKVPSNWVKTVFAKFQYCDLFNELLVMHHLNEQPQERLKSDQEEL